MKVWLILVLALSPLTSLEAGSAKIGTLIEQVKHTKNTSAGISIEEQALAKKIVATGSKAIPELLPLLEDPNRNVRALTAYILIDIKGLTEEHLDALMASCRREESGGWIPSAIAQIGTPKAIDCLFEKLRSFPETGTQITWAISSLKEKGVPRLVGMYETDQGWNARLEEAVEEILHNLGPAANGAVDPLLKIAHNERIDAAIRARCVKAVGAIGLAAERAEPDLLQLADDYDRRVRQAATGAILTMGCSAAAPILAEQLADPAKEKDRRWNLRDIAALHSRGRSVGHIVAKYLSSDDWEMRVFAARTLGYIGYQENNADLIQALDNTEDWRLVLSAAEALGRLQVKEALPALTRVSKTHWYPPVSAAATTAIADIRHHVHPEAENFYSEFASYTQIGQKLDRPTEAEADRIRFPGVVISSPLPKDRPKNFRLFGDVRCGIKVEEGFLVGRFTEDRGEIALTDFDTVSRPIASVPYTEAIYQTGGGIVAITGQEDTGTQTGLLYRLGKDTAGDWQATPWRQLPGPPQFSRLLQNGKLFVYTLRGIVIVSTNGEMQLLTRKQALRSPQRPSK